MKSGFGLVIACLALFQPMSSRGETAGGYSVWLVPWDAADAAAGGCFEELNPFAFALSSSSALTVIAPALLKEAALRRKDGVLVVPAAVNDMIVDGKTVELKSGRALRRFLSEYARTARHIEELAAAARDFDGIEIDYERIPPDLWAAYADFIKGLGAALHRDGKKLFIDVEPSALGNKEMPKLVSAADRIKVMAYYERGVAAAQPAADDSKSWVVDTARQALRLVPAEKLVVALSLSGTDWAPAAPSSWRGTRLSYGQVQDLLSKSDGKLRRDESSVPSVKVVRDGREHEIWYEDEKSLGEKIRALHWIGVKRIAFWYWGRVHPDADVLGLCRP